MATYNDGPYDAEFLLSELPGWQSRETITLKDTGDDTPAVLATTILGKIVSAAATAAAVAGNTGNGAFGAVTTSAGVKVGVYKVYFIEPGTNAGRFVVEDPDGIEVGVGTVAVAFTGGGLSFTIADGATDFVSGDAFTVTVAAGSGKYVALNLSATDGSQNPAGILWATTDASNGDIAAVAIMRGAEVKSTNIIYPDGATDNQKAAIVVALAALGIFVRTTL